TDNQIQYCKICVKEYEKTCKQPYLYTKSNGSTGHLTYHLHDKHNITASNYKEHLDSSQEEGLKQVNNIHQCFKNIQAFFWLPKQAQRLRETQINTASTSSQGINSNNESINPLEVLTDSKTCWNLAYLAWKRISELHPIMHSLAVSLQLKPDTMSKKDGEKLDQLCLNSVEKKYFKITRHFSGSKYPTINLIYPYVQSSDDNTSISSGNENSILSILKLLPFTTNDERKNIETQLRAKLAELESQFNQNNTNDKVTIITEKEECNSLTANENELTRYLKEQIAHKNQDSLMWWKERRTNFLLLCQLARKYLSISAMLFPFECLFFDAGAHITARRTHLELDL
ncbi:16892_t:CDS:2, partial [Gigaspora margarita]